MNSTKPPLPLKATCGKAFSRTSCLTIKTDLNYITILAISQNLIVPFSSCAIDDTVEFYPSITGAFRFGLEAFEFVDQPFLFMHCHVVICNASDAQSRCARGCEKKRRRRRKVGHHSVFSLTQGPITLDYNNEYQEQDDNLAVDNHMHTARE